MKLCPTLAIQFYELGKRLRSDGVTVGFASVYFERLNCIDMSSKFE